MPPSDRDHRITDSLVTLHGTGSSDPDGPALVFSWTQLSGPAVAPTGGGTATATFTAPNRNNLSCAALVFQLSVTDPCGAAATDTVTITVIDNLILQDDHNGVCLVVRPTCSGNTATYCWKRSGGSSLSGPCTFVIQGTTLNLSSTAADPNLLQGGADLTRRAGNVRLIITRASPQTILSIADGNIDNSTCVCP